MNNEMHFLIGSLLLPVRTPVGPGAPAQNLAYMAKTLQTKTTNLEEGWLGLNACLLFSSKVPKKNNPKLMDKLISVWTPY